MTTSEIESNFNHFLSDLESTFLSNRSAIIANRQFFLESYTRISSLNAWRSHILEEQANNDSVSFFLEAQNDALISHVNAQYGLWRSSLQSLRSCLENTILCLYYKDHPVELELWKNEKFRIGFSELRSYFDNHPNFQVDPQITGVSLLKGEYDKLSKAVHGSSLQVRMTDGNEIKISSTEPEKMGQWHTSEKKIIQSINLILITEFHELLEGASNRLVRESISHCLTDKQKQKVNESFNIRIP